MSQDSTRPSADDPIEVDLLTARIRERQRDLEILERDLERVESNLEEGSGMAESSRLEPQYLARLGGVDRQALEVFALRHHNLDQSMGHLRVQVENLHRKMDGLTDESLRALQRLEFRAEWREQERNRRLQKWQRSLALWLALALFVLVWTAVALT